MVQLGCSYAEKKKKMNSQPCFACAYLVIKSCATLCNPMDCNLPGSSVHGIFQARILERVAISFSRDYWSGLPFPSPGNLPDPRIEPESLALAGGFFTTEPPGKLQINSWISIKAIPTLKSKYSQLPGCLIVPEPLSQVQGPSWYPGFPVPTYWAAFPSPSPSLVLTQGQSLGWLGTLQSCLGCC